MAKAEELTARDVREMLDALEEGIELLRVAYDKYFSGVDRVAPQRQSDRLHRLLRRCEATRPRQTALRFRLNTLRARLNTYKHYWTRVMVQIENGTYRRHRDRVKRKQRELEAMTPTTPPAGAGANLDDELDAFLANAFESEGVPTKPSQAREVGDPTAPAANKTPPPPPPARGKAPPPPPPPVPGMEPRAVRALYDELVKAKRAAGEDTKTLTYRGLCKQLARDATKLRKKHGNVRFVVAADGGKVRLKAKIVGSG